STAYFDAAALSAIDTEMNITPLFALLSTGVNGMPPTTARFARFHTGYAPGAPVSAPPRMKAGFLSAIWPAQRPEVEGWPSAAHAPITATATMLVAHFLVTFMSLLMVWLIRRSPRRLRPGSWIAGGRAARAGPWPRRRAPTGRG